MPAALAIKEQEAIKYPAKKEAVESPSGSMASLVRGLADHLQQPTGFLKGFSTCLVLNGFAKFQIVTRQRPDACAMRTHMLAQKDNAVSDEDNTNTSADTRDGFGRCGNHGSNVVSGVVFPRANPSADLSSKQLFYKKRSLFIFP